MIYKLNLRTDLESSILTLWDTLPDDIDSTSQQKCLHLLIGNSSLSPQFTDFIRAALELKFEILTFDNIKKTLNLSTIKVRNMCTRILIKLVQLFRKNIWNERCTRVITWERSNNISQRMKTAAHIRNPRASRTQPPADNMDNPEILDDPYIPPPLKPPIESKRDKFERIWKATLPQNKLLITNIFRHNWNFVQSNGTYMNLKCPELANFPISH